MVTSSKQKWECGEIVKVGFMYVRIIGFRSVKEGLPDIYRVESLDGTRVYDFIPHNGITRVYSD